MSAMIIRTAFIGAVALVLSAASAGAQGQSQKQIVISKPVLKSMVANKPKSKTSLGAKIGMVKRKNANPVKQNGAAPTSVREVQILSGKK
jgi:hypothetical protein